MVFKSFKSPFVARSTLKRRSRASFCRTPTSRTPTQGNAKAKAANIKVCVRVRPPNSYEIGIVDSRTVVRPLDDKILVFDPRELQTPSFFKGRVIRDPTSKRNKDLKFAFDNVFDVEANNQDVFERTTKQMLDHLMDGVNCSVFAYGATGAGKTYTMLGTSTAPGVIFRTMQDLYVRIDAAKDDVVCSVEVSYLEIYNETVRDLLRPESGVLAVREDGDQGIMVSGLSLHKPVDANDLFQMLEFGNCNRTQHPTDANKESSRSHAVFQLLLKQSPKTVDISLDVLLSKMALIDLAGSERATATTNSGERFREGANINKSLLALGNCINALAEGKKGAHIPYRDSKLTRILKDSLGGTCHTVMIANVSPSSLTYEDTYNTLKYADRAKHIKAELKKNVYRVDQQIHQYGKIVQELRDQVEEWKAKYKDVQRAFEDFKQKVENEKMQASIQQLSYVLHDKSISESSLSSVKNVEMSSELLMTPSKENSMEQPASPSISASKLLNSALDLDEAFQMTPSASADRSSFYNAASKDFNNENLQTVSKPTRKTHIIENILSVSSTNNHRPPNISPLREIGNVSIKTPKRLMSSPSFLSSAHKTDVDDDGFKRPAFPLPRKVPTLSATQRQTIEEVKRHGLPSFTENFVLNKKNIRTGASTSKPPNSLLKSPSVSNLRDKSEKPSSSTSHVLKKTFSTSNLRRS